MKNKLGKLQSFFTPLHLRTKRNYLERMIGNKVHCMNVASNYSSEYWDGDRSYGYGGYKYIPGYWKEMAQNLIDEYELKKGSKILDIGCGKGYLLHELLLIEPGLDILGFDLSEYAIENSTQLVKPYLFVQKAQQRYEFQDKSFDLVLAIGVAHNLDIFDLKTMLIEVERVGKRSYVLTESYRDTRELFNLQCWALTCKSFFSAEEWLWIFKEYGFNGDYEFIYFE